MVLGGEGADDVRGGGGTEFTGLLAVDPLAKVTVTLDNAANDGQAGEGDNIHSDVENVGTGQGNDDIVGSSAANTLSGDIGDDDITGGGGEDLLVGDEGGLLPGETSNDTFHARDGFADNIICGEGSDTAIVDTLDTVTDCETVDRAAFVPPVVDPGPGPGPVRPRQLPQPQLRQPQRRPRTLRPRPRPRRHCRRRSR